MTKIYTGASMSLDGYIAGPGESGFDRLFAWYGNGDIAVPTAKPDMTLSMTAVNAEHWRTIVEQSGAIVVGRKLYDFTRGWDGTHPLGVPVVVLTHEPPADVPQGDTPFTFVTEGIEAAVAAASELAGGKGVGVNGGTIAAQCLDAGLLDEVWIDLVPVLLGGGTPFFPGIENVPAQLEGPISVVEGEDVTHLRYRVRRV
jgi:dihydrofolate reductase